MNRRPLIGIQQIGLEGADTEAEVAWRTRQMLSRVLNLRRVVAFVGSGVSRSYGYPSWWDFARSIVEFTLAATDLAPDGPTRALLTSFGVQPDGTSSPLSDTDRTLVTLGVCDDLFRRAGPERHRALRAKVESLVHRAEGPIGASDPLRTVMEQLEITRFLTVNYDVEIERAFVRVKHCPRHSLGLDTGDNPTPGNDTSSRKASPLGAVRRMACSLTAESDTAETLIQFAMGTPGYEWGVFHLHGRIDRPESLVVTERDYQRVYLRDDPDHRFHREALSLAFSANPVLFLGVGMSEADLLRPLREFVSEPHRWTTERPLFALHPAPERERDRVEFRRYLHSRFGVKVLYYPLLEGDHSESFCRAVEDLALDWREWWKGWQTKPAARTPAFGTMRKAMIRHYIEPSAPTFPTRDEEVVAQALASPLETGVLLLGHPGTGKGSLGVRLAAGAIPTPQTYQRRFFASAHFTNDLLSMVDAAADHLGGERCGSGNPLDRLERALATGRHLFVLGGLERLLTREPWAEASTRSGAPSGLDLAEPLPLGKATIEEVQSLITLLADPKRRGRSHIVLTTSLDPVLPAGSVLQRVPLFGVSLQALREHPHFRGIRSETLLFSLHRAMRGHAYGLAVVGSALSLCPPDAAQAWLERLWTRLTAMDLRRRTEKAIEHAVRLSLEDFEPTGRMDFVEGVLQRIALFTTPVTVAAVHATFASDDLPVKQVKDAVAHLERSSLVLRVTALQGTEHSPSPPRYTAHTLVRAHVLHQLGAIPDSPGEGQSFRLSGFATDFPELHTESPVGHALVASAVDALLSRLNAENASADPRTQRGLIRAAFGLIRSRWTATTIPRLGWLQEPAPGPRDGRPHYDAYQRRLALLLNAVRKRDGLVGWNSEIEPRHKIEQPSASLYLDELAWLYNEMGLVAFCQGAILDAYALFRSTQHVNAVAERGTEGHRWCQAEINLALVQLERGRLRRAEYHLGNAIRSARALSDNVLQTQAIGYWGLLAHLSGDYGLAERHYGGALELAELSGNRRAGSIFLRHRADLRRWRGDQRASDDAQRSVALAQSGRHPDLVFLARIAESHLELLRGERRGSQVMSSALEFARRVGIPKLEADAHKVQAHIALQHGEVDRASRHAINALSISSSLGMGLRVTAGLVLIGQVTKERGREEASRQVLRSATALGEWQGYQMQTEIAEQALMNLARDPT